MKICMYKGKNVQVVNILKSYNSWAPNFFFLRHHRKYTCDTMLCTLKDSYEKKLVIVNVYVQGKICANCKCS